MIICQFIFLLVLETRGARCDQLPQAWEARPCCYPSNWPLPGMSGESNSGGYFLSLSPRCFQNLQWMSTHQRLLKVHYPKLEASEDCLYLNIYAPAHADEGSNLPVRLPACYTWGPAGRSLVLDPGGCLGVWNWTWPLLHKREIKSHQ